MPPKSFRAAPFKRHPEYQNRLARIQALLDAGNSHREIAGAMGLSKQRIQQLIKLLPTDWRSSGSPTRGDQR